MRNEELNWETIYLSWKSICEKICPNVLNNNLFKEIKIIPRDDIDDNITDWWDTKNVDLNIKQLNDKGIITQSILWYSPTFPPTHSPGVVNTAKMLWKYKENSESVALIFIMSFMKHCEDSLLMKWHKKGYIIYNKVYEVVSNEMINRSIDYCWQGRTKYFIPETIGKNIYKEPSDINDLMRIICIDVLLSTTKYTLVHITKKD